MDVATSDWTVYQNVKDGVRSLRAMRKIRQGETIYEIPAEDVRFLHGPDMYSLEISPGLHLDCEYLAIGAMNHSCNPNAALKRLRIVAWACIQPGEEITIDYKRTETKLAAPFDCDCGAKNCKGRIE